MMTGALKMRNQTNNVKFEEPKCSTENAGLKIAGLENVKVSKK